MPGALSFTYRRCASAAWVLACSICCSWRDPFFDACPLLLFLPGILLSNFIVILAGLVNPALCELWRVVGITLGARGALSADPARRGKEPVDQRSDFGRQARQ